MGTIEKGCYFCRLHNHSHDTCGPFKKFTRLALAAKTNATDSNSTTKATILNETQSPPSDTKQDNIISDKVNTYVASCINTTNIKPHIVLLSNDIKHLLHKLVIY